MPLQARHLSISCLDRAKGLALLYRLLLKNSLFYESKSFYTVHKTVNTLKASIVFLPANNLHSEWVELILVHVLSFRRYPPLDTTKPITVHCSCYLHWCEWLCNCAKQFLAFTDKLLLCFELHHLWQNDIPRSTVCTQVVSKLHCTYGSEPGAEADIL